LHGAPHSEHRRAPLNEIKLIHTSILAMNELRPLSLCLKAFSSFYHLGSHASLALKKGRCRWHLLLHLQSY
jgi:hypothetical protein